MAFLLPRRRALNLAAFVQTCLYDWRWTETSQGREESIFNRPELIQVGLRSAHSLSIVLATIFVSWITIEVSPGMDKPGQGLALEDQDQRGCTA